MTVFSCWGALVRITIKIKIIIPLGTPNTAKPSTLLAGSTLPVALRLSRPSGSTPIFGCRRATSAGSRPARRMRRVRISSVTVAAIQRGNSTSVV